MSDIEGLKSLRNMCVDALKVPMTEFNTFANIVSEYIALFSTEDMALAYNASQATIARWARGTSHPFPAIAIMVIKQVQKRCEEAILPILK